MKTDVAAFLVILTIVLIKCCTIAGQEDYYHPPVELMQHVDSREVKCLVCKATVNEMLETIEKVDPNKRVEVGGYRIDSTGNSITRSVQLSKSETYLTELMENICDKMDDYVKAKYKKNKQLTIMKLTTPTGGMNPEMSAVDFIQDGDLNKSLKHFCLEVLEDNEEAVLKEFMKEQTSKNIDIEICSIEANYCDDQIPDDSLDDYVLEEHDEL